MVNRDETGLRADRYFETCFRAAERVYRESRGAFDITVGPIVNAWGFGYTEASEIDSATIRELLQLVGMDMVRIENGIILKDKPGIILDMNAIAQGYAVDVVYEYFRSEGLENFLVEIGGEVRTSGTNPKGTGWRIGIDRPVEGLQIPGADLEAVIQVRDRSLATSGNYRRFYEKDGIKYSHSIDPLTGWPVQHGLLSATVLCDECVFADAYATMFMVMGIEKSREFLENRPDLDAFLIYNDENGMYRIWSTENLKKNTSRNLP
jgi:thiamine biosynthesis lipoprotein